MSLRVVLYAEGSGETRGELSALQSGPGTPLAEEQLGPAHLLVRRAIASARGLPEGAVLFEAPLRTARGLVAHGSDFLHKTTLRRLLTWPDLQLRPGLAIVLVDADGETDRGKLLEQHIEGLAHAVIGVATQEFEAWLIADHVALNGVLGLALQESQSPENMKPREAKEMLATEWPRARRRTLRTGRSEVHCARDVARCSREAMSWLRRLSSIALWESRGLSARLRPDERRGRDSPASVGRDENEGLPGRAPRGAQRDHRSRVEGYELPRPLQVRLRGVARAADFL